MSKERDPHLPESRFIRELRKQIIKLKRENSQLRKRNTRIENDYAEHQATVDAELDFVEAVEEVRECPHCKSSEDVAVFKLKEVEYFKCHVCGKKGRKIIE
jgi:hypothetical protein